MIYIKKAGMAVSKQGQLQSGLRGGVGGLGCTVKENNSESQTFLLLIVTQKVTWFHWICRTVSNNRITSIRNGTFIGLTCSRSTWYVQLATCFYLIHKLLVLSFFLSFFLSLLLWLFISLWNQYHKLTETATYHSLCTASPSPPLPSYTKFGRFC